MIVLPETVKEAVALTRSPGRRSAIALLNSTSLATSIVRFGVNGGRVSV